ncbi:DUF177 domain-containing protein [Gemmatimonas aurantiaca]|nr:DUF177 domain-containing protein [Gemmatimonas aurantiaca]
MKVKFKEIETFPAELSLTARPEELDFELAEVRLAEGVGIDMSIQQTDTEYFVNGECSATVEMDCARCLEVAQIELHGELSLVVIRPTAGDTSAFGKDGDEAIRLDVDEVLNLDDYIRQALFTEVPLKPLCREDCRGLCSVCGANKNEGSCDCEAESRDSRWDALRDSTED